MPSHCLVPKGTEMRRIDVIGDVHESSANFLTCFLTGEGLRMRLLFYQYTLWLYTRALTLRVSCTFTIHDLSSLYPIRLSYESSGGEGGGAAGGVGERA